MEPRYLSNRINAMECFPSTEKKITNDRGCLKCRYVFKCEVSLTYICFGSKSSHFDCFKKRRVFCWLEKKHVVSEGVYFGHFCDANLLKIDFKSGKYLEKSGKLEFYCPFLSRFTTRRKNRICFIPICIIIYV